MGPPGPSGPRWRPLYVQRQDSEQESLYESVGGACWWRCRRPGRAQTLEFHSRGPGGAAAGPPGPSGPGAPGPAGRTHTVPRLRALCGVRVQLDARLSASCAAIDVALPPCVLLLPRRDVLPEAQCRLPEAQRRLPEAQRRLLEAQRRLPEAQRRLPELRDEREEAEAAGARDETESDDD